MLNIEDLTKRAVTGNYFPHGDVTKADCAIGFSFGYREEVDGEIQPGISNKDLASFAGDLEPGIPLILQFEIADALENPKGKIYRIERHRQEREYLDTVEVATQAFIIMQEHQWRSPLVFAHPGHIPRVDAVCQKLGMFTIVPSGLNVVRFDSLSKQGWTRNPRAWGEHEIGAISRSRQKGQI